MASVAVRPDGLLPDPAGPIEGIVVGRVFRRDHFLVRVVRVAPAGGASGDGGDAGLDVAWRGDGVPATGDRVRLRTEPGAVVRFDAPGDD